MYDFVDYLREQYRRKRMRQRLSIELGIIALLGIVAWSLYALGKVGIL